MIKIKLKLAQRYSQVLARIVRINDYSLDFKPNQYQLVTCHKDKPGIVGQTGNLLGSHGINIASMTLGRNDAGGDALMILSIDDK